jgi:hypothetical protein
MPIIMPDPPQQAKEAVSQWTKRKSTRGAQELSIEYSLRVYIMDLEDLAAGRDLVAARPGPWRHLETAASVDVVPSAGMTHRVAHHAMGRRNTETTRAVKRCLEDAHLRSGSYELRLLSIPALSITSLWLLGESGSVIIPLPPTFPPLVAEREYRDDDFLPALRELAKKRLQFDNSPQRTGKS